MRDEKVKVVKKTKGVANQGTTSKNKSESSELSSQVTSQLESIQKMDPPKKGGSSSSGGKKGGSYFSRTGYTDEDIARAEAETGKTSAHGSGTSGVSGISSKTTKEEAELVDVLRKNKAADKAASRPKAQIKEQRPLEDFEKVKKMLESMAAETSDLGQLQSDFEKYMERREYSYDDFTEAQQDALLEFFIPKTDD